MTDSERVNGFVVDRCEQALARRITTNARVRRLTAFDWVWFQPTRAQVAAGARWLRCDLVLYAGRTRLVPLPRVGRPEIEGSVVPDRQARCYSGLHRGSYYTTVCTRPHLYRAETTYRLRGRTYPGPRRQAAESVRRCGPDTALVFYPTEF